jgi:hypothetical protein
LVPCSFLKPPQANLFRFCSKPSQAKQAMVVVVLVVGGVAGGGVGVGAGLRRGGASIRYLTHFEPIIQYLKPSIQYLNSFYHHGRLAKRQTSPSYFLQKESRQDKYLV